MSRIAGITAAILLLAQTVGVAHFHPLPSQQKYVTNAAVSVDDGLCALCLVRFHSPAALVVAPHPTAPMLVEVTAPGAASDGAAFFVSIASLRPGSARVGLNSPFRQN